MASAGAYSGDPCQRLASSALGNSITTSRRGCQSPSSVSQAPPRTRNRPPCGLSVSGTSAPYSRYASWSWTSISAITYAVICSPSQIRPAGPNGHGGRAAAISADPGGTLRIVRASRCVVQLHDATALHFDLRIQAGGVLRSWAVPRGPSLDPGVRRLAVPVEDHALSAGDFEGVHEGQPRGSGAVIIWDEGPAEIL